MRNSLDENKNRMNKEEQERIVGRNIEILIDHNLMDRDHPAETHEFQFPEQEGYVFCSPIVCRGENIRRKLLYRTETGQIDVPKLDEGDGTFSSVGLIDELKSLRPLIGLQKTDLPIYRFLDKSDHDYGTGDVKVDRIRNITQNIISSEDNDFHLRPYTGSSFIVGCTTLNSVVSQVVLMGGEEEGIFGSEPGDEIIGQTLQGYTHHVKRLIQQRPK